MTPQQIGWLARAAIATLTWAHGEVPNGTDKAEDTDPLAGLKAVLEVAPDDTRRHFLTALRAVADWQQRDEVRQA